MFFTTWFREKYCNFKLKFILTVPDSLLGQIGEFFQQILDANFSVDFVVASANIYSVGIFFFFANHWKKNERQITGRKLNSPVPQYKLSENQTMVATMLSLAKPMNVFKSLQFHSLFEAFN